MKWNPLINALFAVIYIGGVALFMRFIESARHDTPDTFVDGMGFLSLFVLSVAVMAFLFFYQPLVFLMEKKSKEGFTYLIEMLGTFGALTVCALIIASLQ